MLFYAIFLGCDDHKFTGGHSSDVAVEGEDYSAVQAVLEGNGCTGCHAGGIEPNLTEELCMTAVDVASSQYPSMILIEAGSSESSYLYHKVAGTHLDVGGNGDSMPPGGSISEEHLTVLESWINSGASCDGTSEDTEEIEEPEDSDTATQIDTGEEADTGQEPE